MENLQDIERAAEAFALARASLAAYISELTCEIDTAKRKHLPAIRRAVARFAEKRAALEALIADNQALFAKPKTRVLHGVRVGYQKQPGAIEITDEAETIARIKKMFSDDPDMLRQLIKTSEKPIKDALGELSGEKLKKLGVKVTDDTDKMIIKTTDSEVDKIVDALLKDAGEEG